MVVEFVKGESNASVKSFVFGAKHLSAGWHKITLEWRATQGSTAILGDRTVLILGKPGAIPDIAEPLFFGPGRLNNGDNLTGLEPVIGEWYTDLEDHYDYVVAAHELGHQVLGLYDLYFPTSHAAQAGRYDLMSSSGDFISHIAAPYKLALGWARPTMLESDGLKLLTDVKVSEGVYILPRRRDEKWVEYFALDNRQSDLVPGLYDESLNDSGIAVWQVIERVNDMLQAPRGVSTDLWSNGLPPTIGRMGIRLQRPWTAAGTVAGYVSSESLWDSERYDLLSAGCPGGAGGGIVSGIPGKNTLTWADCTASGYNILNVSGPGEQMNFQLEID
jgi:hypothetical protein